MNTSSDGWSRYWSLTRRGAIDLAGPDPVAAALRAYWDRQVPGLQRCTCVADVGSGPAILARHMMTSHPDALRGMRWICIDEARIALPPESAPGLAIQTHYGEDFAQSSPAGAPVDGLVSNFGLEYVDRALVAQACRRWLRPGGLLRCMVHARDSVIDRQARDSAADLALALDDLDFFRRAGDLLDAIATLPADPAARRSHAPGVREAFNAVVDHLKRTMDTRGAPSSAWYEMLQGVHALVELALHGQVDDARAALLQREADYRDEIRRLALMQRCALDAAAVSALADSLRAASFDDVHHHVIECDAGTVAWSIGAVRA